MTVLADLHAHRSGASAARRRWLPGARSEPMPWILAIIIFLTMLAGAAGLGLYHGLNRMHAELAGGYTIQIVEADAAERRQQVEKLLQHLREQKAVANVTVVPEEQLRDQLAPWIGADATAEEIPIPALIDVEMRSGGDNAAIGAIRQAVTSAAPSATIEPHQSYLAPVERLMRGLMWLAVGLVVLMIMVTASVAMLAARSAHEAHRSTIDIMHLLGATDLQVARLFQRRMTIDALFGAVVGSAATALALWGLGNALAETSADMTRIVMLPWRSAMALSALPIFAVLVATLTARITVKRALERSL